MGTATWLLAAGLAATALVGCGGGDDDGGDAAATTTEAETTTTTEPSGDACLVGEMELVSAVSTADLPGLALGLEVTAEDLGELHLVVRDARDWVVGTLSNEVEPIGLAPDGEEPFTVLLGALFGRVVVEGDEVRLDLLGSAGYMVDVPTGTGSTFPARAEEVYALLLPLEEPVEVTCPDGGDITVTGATTTTVLRTVDPPELAPLLEAG